MSMTKEADSHKILIECDFCLNTHEVELDQWANSPIIYWTEKSIKVLGWASFEASRDKRKEVCPECASKNGMFSALCDFEFPFTNEELANAFRNNLPLQFDNNPKTRESLMRQELKTRVDALQKQVEQMTEAANSTQEIIKRAEQRMNEAVSIMQAFVTNLNQREHRHFPGPFAPPSGPANPYPVTFGTPQTPPTPQTWMGGPDPKPCGFGEWSELSGVSDLTHIDFDAIRAAQQVNEGIDASETWAKDFLERKAALVATGGEQGGSSLRAVWEDMAQHPEKYPEMTACSPITEEEKRAAEDDDDDCIVNQFGERAERLKAPAENAGTHVIQYMNPKIARDPNQLIEWETPAKSDDVNLRAETWAVPLDDVLPGLYVNKDKRRSQELVTVERDGRSYVIRETTGEVRSRVDQSQFEKRYQRV
jgi:hypothetical protein